MSKDTKYDPLVSINTSQITLSEKDKQAFDNSLAELVELSLDFSGSSQVARGFLLNLYDGLREDRTFFALESLRKFDLQNKKNVFNILKVFMSGYSNIGQYVTDEQYWTDIKKHYIEVDNE